MPNPPAGSAFTVNPSDIRLDPEGSCEVNPATGGLRARPLIAKGFSGLLARDFTPAPGASYPVGSSTLLSIDGTPDAMLWPLRWEVPVAVGLVRPRVVVVFHDGSEWVDENATGLGIARNQQDLADLMLGGIGQAASNDGKAIRKIELRANNTGGVPNVATVGTFRFRCVVMPRGTGAVL